MIIFDSYDNVPLDFQGQCYTISDESEFWFKPGRIWHREKEPAFICDDGTKEWWIDDCRHRVAGRAVILPLNEMETGDEEFGYFLFGEEYSPTDYWSHPLNVKFVFDSILSLENHETK